MKKLFRLVAFCVVQSLIITGLPAQDPTPALIGYWHNWDDASAPYLALDQIDPRYNVIELAFAEPIAGTSSALEFIPAMDQVLVFRDRVDTLRAQGRTVLLSIGGANAPVQLDEATDVGTFVYTVVSILSMYHLDGIDLDLEGSSLSITGGTIADPIDSTVIRLITAVNECMTQYRQMAGRKLFLTMAPETAYVQGGQSAFGGIWGAYLPLIDALRDSLDILQVQLCNSGSMYGIDGGIYTQGTADFIVSQTEAVIQGFNTTAGFFNGLPAEKVAVALPACANAAGGGYADTATVRAAMEYLLGEGPQPGSYTLVQAGGYPDLRGMMTWSINWDAVSTCDGTYSYAENYERIFGDAGMGLHDPSTARLVIAPNPVTDELALSVPMQGPITIRDLSGRIVRRMSGSSAMQRIDVRGLSTGIYLLDGESGAGRLQARFVKR